MATQGKAKRPSSKVSVPNRNFVPPPVPMGLVSPVKSSGEEIMGWIASCVLVALLLPLGAMLYLDVLQAKYEVKEQVEKVEKLRREIERKNRDKQPSNISDNPVFDRLRRPVQVSLSRPEELGKGRM